MPQIVISASRRTDIPAFYMPWFMDQIDQGYFEVVNPYNHQTAIVPATPADVHTIVFWSKSFGPFIERGFGEQLQALGYHLFFNFTINSVSHILEPNLPPLPDRLSQLGDLCQRFGARSINWRFDPICFYSTPGEPSGNNLEHFTQIAAQAAHYGVQRCITSFRDDYRKIQRRTDQISGFRFEDPPLQNKVDLLVEMEQRLSALQIALMACCEKEVLTHLPATSRITRSRCIPNDLLMQLFGGDVSLQKDAGQRRQAGCGCLVSKDIGSYNLHPCYHNCLFCYANPAGDGRKVSRAGAAAGAS
jgi:hypothetical protein